VPATGSLAADWGPAQNDVRHRTGVFFGAGWLRNFNANLNASYSSGSPYTIRTGLDDNGDQIFNDRPAWRDAQLTARRRLVQSGRLLHLQHSDRPEEARADAARHLHHGQPRRQLQRADDGGRRAAAISHGDLVNAQNLTNHTNYVGYSGTLTSPFFGQPTAVQGMRKVEVGLNFNF